MRDREIKHAGSVAFTDSDSQTVVVFVRPGGGA